MQDRYDRSHPGTGTQSAIARVFGEDQRQTHHPEGPLSRLRGYEGRGPRSYRRSDVRLMDDVCQALADHPAIDASQMEVYVEQGVVSLRGRIDDRRTRRLCEDVAAGIPGVHDVHNELRVSNLDGSRGTADATTGSRPGTSGIVREP